MRRNERRHVEAMTYWPAAAVGRTFATHPSAISIKWRYSDQSRNFTPIELSQFRHLRQEQCGCTGTDSADRSQFDCFSGEFVRLIDVLFDEQIELIDLPFDLVD